MDFTLKVWRQASPDSEGRLVTYQASHIPPDASFLEILDIVNNGLEGQGEEPIAFEYDCREGICGSCGLMINGRPHGPADRKNKRPFGAAPAGAPRSKAESGPERPGQAAQDGGGSRLRGCPGAIASGRAIVEGGGTVCP